MARFVFTAVTKENTIVKSAIEARNAREAKRFLEERYAYVYKLNPDYPGFLSFLNADIGEVKVRGDNLAGFFMLLGQMVANGFSINDSLISLAKCGDKDTRRLSAELHMRVIEGEDIAEAFRSCRKIVGADYSGYVAVGVKSGNVGEILIRLADNMHKTLDSNKKVKSALTYPLFMAALTVVISLFLFTQTVPMIAESLGDMVGDNGLPFMTELIMGISSFLIKYGVVLALITLVLVIAAVYLGRGPLKPMLHRFLTKIPLFGSIIANKNMSLFFRAIAVAVDSGMPIIEAFELASDNVDNLYIRKHLAKVQRLVEEEGQPMSEAFEKCPFISGIEIPALATGERSGEIGTMTQMCSATLDAQNDLLIRRFTTFINPIMLAVIGGMVGCIMFAVYGPVFSVMQNLG